MMAYTGLKAHDTFKLGYDRIVELLSDVPTNDLRNFLGYCEAWAIAIAEHHDSEVSISFVVSELLILTVILQEAVVFPFLNTKMDFSNEKKQHEVIHTTLDKLLNMINAAKADPSKFSAEDLKKLMVEFREPLVSLSSFAGGTGL